MRTEDLVAVSTDVQVRSVLLGTVLPARWFKQQFLFVAVLEATCLRPDVSKIGFFSGLASPCCLPVSSQGLFSVSVSQTVLHCRNTVNHIEDLP